MRKFIKGLELCRNFFNDCAKTIIDDNFPELKYSAGLIGYGSDVLGYDDVISTDHMWGPRFYLFLSKVDIAKKDKIKDTYAPYSKWFGTAFRRLDIDDKIKQTIDHALSADNLAEREKSLVEAQAFVADLHNTSGLTKFVDYQIENYFGRDIKVIFSDKFAEAAAMELIGTVFENVPLIGAISQIGGVASITDDTKYYKQIMRLYSME